MPAPDRADTINPANRRGVFVEWRWVKLLTLALLAAMLAVGAYFLLRATPSERGTRLLVKAFTKRRLIEPRLSGGFKGGAFTPDRDDSFDIDEKLLQKAELLIEDAVTEGKPETQLAYGRYLLSTGNDAGALKPLRKAVAGMEKNAEARNDLGVCLLKKGQVEDALNEFDLAVKYSPRMPEAAFNRALCYDKLLLRSAANEEYKRLLEIERDSSWLEEIRQRQQAASEPIVTSQKELAIISAFEEALSNSDEAEAEKIAQTVVEALLRRSYTDWASGYLTAKMKGDEKEAGIILTKIRITGRALIDKIGDTSIAEFATYLGGLSIEAAQTESGLIAEFSAAEKQLMSQRDSTVQPIFLRLSKQFETRGNYLFQYYSELRCANCEYNMGSFSASLERLGNARAFIEKHNWPYRLAIFFNNVAVVYSRLGQNSLAFKYCGLALTLSRSMNLSEAKALQYMSNAYYNVRDINNSLQFLRKSTAMFISSLPTNVELSSNFQNIADCYSLLGRHDLALLYAREALTFCADKNLTKQLTRATSFIALEHAKLNQFAEAHQEIEQAFKHLENVEEKQRAFTEATLWSRRGQIEAMQNMNDQAVEDYSKAEKLLDEGQDKEDLLYVLRDRAEAHLQAKDYAKAEEDLERALVKIEEDRAKISDRENRSSFLDASQGVFDEKILLRIQSSGNWVDGFNLSEQSRARTLLDDISEQPASKAPGNSTPEISNNSAKSTATSPVCPLTLQTIQEALPADVRLLTYTVTNQKTFIFVITHDKFEYKESAATTEDLDRLAQQYVTGLKARENLDDLNSTGLHLYRLLIKPVADQIADGKRLVIIPDKALHYIPFAALVDESGKYLLDSLRISYAPSASVLVRCLKEASIKPVTASEKIFAVGNPRFDQSKFPNLKTIPDAETEAIQSAMLYKDRIVLPPENATKRNVLDALRNCEVAHLSLHCLVEEKSSALVLAKPRNGVAGQSASGSAQYSEQGDLLYLNEIYGLSLPRIKLVVLSACQSGLGQFYRGEGMVSLVRPFLALKIPTVVASLWSVDSQATSVLMIDFHKERTGPFWQAGDALREAQIKMSRSEDYQHPFYWAPFIVVGV